VIYTPHWRMWLSQLCTLSRSRETQSLPPTILSATNRLTTHYRHNGKYEFPTSHVQPVQEIMCWSTRRILPSGLLRHRRMTVAYHSSAPRSGGSDDSPVGRGVVEGGGAFMSSRRDKYGWETAACRHGRVAASPPIQGHRRHVRRHPGRPAWDRRRPRSWCSGPNRHREWLTLPSRVETA